MKIQVCVVQDNPVFFDKGQTIDKMEGIIARNAQEGCELIVFPESFIPGYPRGFSFGTVVGRRSEEGRNLFVRYRNNSINLQDDDTKRLIELARTYKVYLCIGVTESHETNGSLYCSMLYISPTKGLLGVHRKIKPTGTERLIWAEAGGESLVTFKTKIGRLGGLICWENYMPFARMSMFQKGVQIYIAPTADSRENWIATMRHIALEGRCFVLGCNQYYTRSMYPAEFQEEVKEEKEEMCEGGSVIISPMGKILAGPLYGQSGCLIAELDLVEVAGSKLDFDVIGHYAREDIFRLDIKNQPDTLDEDDL